MVRRRSGDAPVGAGNPVELVACTDRRGFVEPYDRLLGDAMQGDSLLFAREDEVEAAWRHFVEVGDSGGAVVPATVSYDSATATAA